MKVTDFLTNEQLKQCADTYKKASPGTFAKTICKEVIKPNMQIINEKLGQENDPLYLSYVVEYELMKSEKIH